MKLRYILYILLFLAGCSNDNWRYLGQPLPGQSPQLFAPEFINHHAHSAPTFRADGKEMYWSVTSEPEAFRKILFTRYDGNHWTEPMMVPFAGDFHDDQPFISVDGKFLYFASKRPKWVGDTLNTNLAIWRTERSGNGWGKPELVDSRHGFWTPSQTQDGTLYFLGRVGDKVGICRSECVNGEYSTAELLPEPVNINGYRNVCPFIAPDESFLLFASNRPGSKDEYGDLYICFRDDKDNWSKVIDLGNTVNSDKQERFPGISPDGKYFFFTRWHSAPHHHDLYWMDAGFIDKIRKKAKL